MRKVRRRFPQKDTRRPHARQLDPQQTDHHLHGAHWIGLDSFELALLMRHDPVEQRLIDYAQRAHRRRNALDEAYQTRCLMLEFQRLARS